MSIRRKLISKLAKRVGKTAGKKGAKKALTFAQRNALKKAVKASALARRKVAKGAVKKVSRRAMRKTVKTAVRKQARTTVKGLKLARNAKSGRVLQSNFKGKAGKALKKASYQARLNSSRLGYSEASTRSKLAQATKGYFMPTGVLRRSYKDLTLGENVRRNLGRNLKANAVAAGVGLGVGVAYGANESRKTRRRR
jgi:hypothetical protein